MSPIRSYDEVLAHRESAERPSGPDSVQWWLDRHTVSCSRPESTPSTELYKSYVAEIGAELGNPVGLHLWSALMTEHGHPSVPVRREGRMVRVRYGVRLP